MTISKHILSTRPLPEALLQNAAGVGFGIDVLSFIDTVAVVSETVQQQIAALLPKQATVVFTSMNAVEAIAPFIANQPNWQVHCMGNTTRLLAEMYFGKAAVQQTGSNATELANNIVAANPAQPVYFFCGNQRRGELPDILNNNGIQLYELEVYETIETAHPVEKEYDAVLFYSPSAVHSFFKVNTLPASTILFAIGDTTARSIAQYTFNKVVISSGPSKEGMVRQMMAYFQQTGLHTL